MRLQKTYFLFLVLVFLFVGCAKETGVPIEAPSAPTKTPDLSQTGALKGKVIYEGPPPAAKMISVKGNPECAVLHPGGNVASEELVVNGGNLQNVFVYVKEGLEGYSFEPPAVPVTIENKTCVYVPHVSGLQVNQPVILLNQDPTLHNIHSYSKNSKPWNLGLPFQGMKQTKKFEAPEVMVTLKCDVHPWMIGYVGVLPHPYFAVSDASGEFEIKNLPPGEYMLEAWHEKLGVQSQKIKIEPQETKSISLSFKN